MDLSAFNYSAKFKAAIAFTLMHECVFARGHYGDMNYVIAEHDPKDPGGTTKYGIDQRDHPTIDVETLDLAGAIEIYYRGITDSRDRIIAGGEWAECFCELMPDRWAFAVFEVAVNPGPGDEQHEGARKWLQRAIGATPDGVIGPKTIAAVKGAGDDELRLLLARRDAYYRSLATQKPRFQRFLPGWLARNNDLRRALHLV